MFRRPGRIGFHMGRIRSHQSSTDQPFLDTLFHHFFKQPPKDFPKRRFSPAQLGNCTVIRHTVKHIQPQIPPQRHIRLDALLNLPFGRNSIQEYHRFISAVLAQAEKEMLVTYNAAQKATPPKLERKEADYFQPEEVEQIRDALEGEPVKWRAVTHLLLITGVRRGELCGLRWDRIDWENHQIKIDRTILYSPDRGIYESSTKTGNVRFIKLPQETMELLREYRVWYNEQRLLNGDRWTESGYVFVKEAGGPMMPDSVNAWLNKFSKRKGLPPIHPHKFRHTMASLLYFNHADSVSISKRLGHARVSTTTDIYSHLIAQADEAASQCIADAVLRKKA